MANASLNDFIIWLKEKHEKIADLEKEALHLLHNKNDDAGYRQKMHEKAEIIAKLYTDAQPKIVNIPQKDIIEKTLKEFSNGGKMAINLNSIFYMSALLYPDDHKKGEPDNLEKFINKIKNI